MKLWAPQRWNSWDCFCCVYCGACSHSLVLTVHLKCQSESIWSACQILCLVTTKDLSTRKFLDIMCRCYWTSACHQPFVAVAVVMSSLQGWVFRISDIQGNFTGFAFEASCWRQHSETFRVNRLHHFQLNSRVPECLIKQTHRIT